MDPRPADHRWLCTAAVIHRWTWIIGFPAILLWLFAPLPDWLDLSLLPFLTVMGVSPLLIRTMVGFRRGYRGG